MTGNGRARYFFGPGDRAAIAERAGREFPEECAWWTESADRFLAGYVKLPTSFAPDWTFIGKAPDWDWNRRHPEDMEFLWSLSRCYPLNDLARAWAVSGEDKYAAGWAAAIDGWIRSCPHRLEYENVSAANGKHPWRILEAGFRLFDAWPFGLAVLEGHPAITPELRARIRESAAEQAAFIRRWSPATWPRANHNHYLYEMSGLLFAGLFLLDDPELAAFATRELDRCIGTQFNADGGQIEACPSYHNGCVRRGLLDLRIARLNGIALSADWDGILRRAAGFSAIVSRPDGSSVPVGDSDSISPPSAFWFAAPDTASPRADIVLWGAAAILDDAPAAGTVRAGGEWLWYLGPGQAVPATGDPPALCSLLKETGFASFRDRWGADATGATVKWGANWMGHSHADLLSFEYYSRGRPVVVDPGRYEYNGTPRRRALKMAAAHSCALPEGHDQAVYIDSWKWAETADCAVESWEEEADRIRLAARLTAKGWRHRRTFTFTPADGRLVIEDELELSGSAAGFAVTRFPLAAPEVPGAIACIAGGAERTVEEIEISPRYGVLQESRAVVYRFPFRDGKARASFEIRPD